MRRGEALLALARAQVLKRIADWIESQGRDTETVVQLRLEQAHHESNAALLSFQLLPEREDEIRARVEHDLRCGNTSRDPDVRTIDEGNVLNERAWMLLDLLDAFDAARRQADPEEP